MKVKVKEGIIFKHPDGRIVKDGEEVPDNQYFMRALECGDLVKYTEPKTKKDLINKE